MTPEANFQLDAPETPVIHFEVVTFRQATLFEVNQCLEVWGHKMGPVLRGNQSGINHLLMHGKEPVAATTVHTLIRENVGGGHKELTRENTIELSRLCAVRPGLCRVALRLWREFVFPNLGYQYAMSCQDADLHNGNTYRFDGWTRGGFARSGKDTRSGRPGRNKWVWIWEQKSY